MRGDLEGTRMGQVASDNGRDGNKFAANALCHEVSCRTPAEWEFNAKLPGFPGDSAIRKPEPYLVVVSVVVVVTDCAPWFLGTCWSCCGWLPLCHWRSRRMEKSDGEKGWDD